MGGMCWLTAYQPQHQDKLKLWGQQGLLIWQCVKGLARKLLCLLPTAACVKGSTAHKGAATVAPVVVIQEACMSLTYCLRGQCQNCSCCLVHD